MCMLRLRLWMWRYSSSSIQVWSSFRLVPARSARDPSWAEKVPKIMPGDTRKTMPGAAARSQRYVLFDVAQYEQLNKQRRAIMFFLDLAINAQRTLVLPRARLFGRVGRPAGPQRYVAWSALLNVSLMAELHPVIELDQYLKLERVSGGVPIDELIIVGGATCAPRSGKAVAFNGIDGVGVGHSRCAHGLQYDIAAVRASPSRALAFAGTTDQLGMGKALRMRPHVRFVQSVYEEAASFVSRVYGSAHFVALHWRRTDFLRVRQSQPGVLQSADALVSHARTLMARHHSHHVYLATDSDDDGELARVAQGLGFAPDRYDGALAVSAAGQDDPLARAIAANVEITICATAAGFIGTRTSTFSLSIAEERQGVFGRPAASAGEMGDVRAPQRNDHAHHEDL